MNMIDLLKKNGGYSSNRAILPMCLNDNWTLSYEKLLDLDFEVVSKMTKNNPNDMLLWKFIDNITRLKAVCDKIDWNLIISDKRKYESINYFQNLFDKIGYNRKKIKNLDNTP